MRKSKASHINPDTGAPLAPAIPPTPERTALYERHPLLSQTSDSQPLVCIDYSRMQIREIVESCMNLYRATLLELTDKLRLDPLTAKKSAANAWKADLPELADKHSVLAYIACVAWGQRMGLLEPTEVKTMIFMAQTQLSVLKQSIAISPGAGRISALAATEDRQLALPGTEDM